VPPNTGTGLDGGIQHAGQIDIDAVDGLAGDLQRDVQVLLLGPIQRELVRSFDLDFSRIGQRDLRSLDSERPIGGPASDGVW